MIVHIDCEICNRTKTEERDFGEELRLDPFAKERCNRCREYMRERLAFVESKLAALSHWPWWLRWLREWKYGLDFDDLQGHRIKYDIPVGGFVAPKNYVPMPDVKPPKADKEDIGALANLIIQGFDTAKDKDVTVSLTYRRVGDVVDASGTIEVIDVRPVVSGPSQADIDDVLARADKALRDEPTSVAGCSAEDVAAAENAQCEWLMAATENKLNQLGFLWIALQHALRKHPDADIRSAVGNDQLYSEVREIMAGDKHGKRN